MRDVEKQKIKLEQKKNRLIAEETRLKQKERKMRTRYLIEAGGLIVKAGLDHLPTNTLYGALLSLTTSLKSNPSIKDEWVQIGKDKFEQEQANKHGIVLKFAQEPSSEARRAIRNHGLKWNTLRQEWWGYVSNPDSLKRDLDTVEYKIEQI